MYSTEIVQTGAYSLTKGQCWGYEAAKYILTTSLPEPLVKAKANKNTVNLSDGVFFTSCTSQKSWVGKAASNHMSIFHLSIFVHYILLQKRTLIENDPGAYNFVVSACNYTEGL